jgi:hypothetical protein
MHVTTANTFKIGSEAVVCHVSTFILVVGSSSAPGWALRMMRNAALSLAILVLIVAILLFPDSPTVSAQSSTTVTLAASGDTYLKGGTPNTNEGASTFVRVQQSGPNRALVRFSQSEIQAAVDGGILVSAKVQMTIIDNGNNWGTTGRTVDVHRVLMDWTEGNGLSGEGATWNCPKDTNIANQVPDGPPWKDLGPPYKDGGSYVVTPTSTITITNGMSGVVEWTVTADVAAFLAGTSNYGWIIRKTDEGSSGRADFASKENGVTNNRPQLVITYASPPISKIVFTTSPQALTAGVPSAVMTIQTQDANDNPANVASDTTIALSSTSHSGEFSLSMSPWSDAVSLTISAGSNSVSFYYKDTIAGTPTITAAENPSEGWIDATQQETVNPAALEHFDFSPIGSPQTSGVAFTITITSKDVYGNTVTSYTGSNTLSDSTGTMDPTATDVFSSGVWSGSATATKAQAGVVITTTGNGKSGTSDSFNVNPAGSNKLVITVYPPSLTVGSSRSKYIVQRQGQYDNPATSGLITVNLESSSTGNAKSFALTPDGAIVTSVTIQDGFSTSEFYYYDEKSGTWMISVSATGVTGDSKPLTVNPSTLASFTISDYPSSTTAGQNFGSNDVTVTAYDAYGNVKTDYTGQVYFTSTDQQAVLPCTSGSRYTFTTGAGGDNGVHAFAGTGFTLNTLGSHTISVTDGTVSLTSFPITVSPAAVSITITSDPTGSGFVKVDGSSIITPQTFMWVIGSTHDLEALSPASGGSGIQYVWTSWSDGGGQSHTYTTLLSPQTVTANYGTHEEIVTSTGSGTAYFDTNTGVLSDLSAVNEASLPAAGRPNLIFPHGLFSFTITDLTPGGTANVTMTLPSAVPVGTQYWKYGPTPTDPTNHWYQLPMGDDDGDNMITITLVNGGLGDDDLTLDGIIIDQGGPANPPAPLGAPVGGYVAPVNRLAILAPFLVLFGVTAAVTVLASVPRRHVH